MAEAPNQRPHCTRCAHYFITFDAHFPYGCRAMNFKSKGLPQNEVQGATGAGCLAFQARKAAGTAGGRDA